MQKSETAKLREAVRNCLVVMFEGEQANGRTLLKMMHEQHEDVVQACAQSLADDAILKIASNERKRANAQVLSPSQQLVLPLALQDLRRKLPPSITLKSEDENDFDWVALSDATFAQLTEYEELLAESIKADRQTLSAIKQLRMFVGPLMANEPGLSVGEALLRVVEEEGSAAA